MECIVFNGKIIVVVINSYYILPSSYHYNPYYSIDLWP